MPVVRREDGADVWWDAVGPEDGEPVVLVMGLAMPSDLWHRQVPALSARHRVLLLDNRGAGRTGDVVGAPYTPALLAADVLAVLDAAGAARAHVVGVSLGGVIAQELALSAPERVASLALLATHCGLAHATVTPEAIDLLTRRATMSPMEAAEASIPFNYAPGTPRTSIEEDWAIRARLPYTQEGYAAQVTGGATWSSYDRLPELVPPTVVIHGAEDRLVPPDNGRLIAERAGARLELVPDANHMLMTDQPERVNTLLLQWFAEHPVG